MTTPYFVNLIGLSDLLKIPTQWLDLEAKANRIPFLQIGRQRWFCVEAVRRTLSDRAAMANPKNPDSRFKERKKKT